MEEICRRENSERVIETENDTQSILEIQIFGVQDFRYISSCYAVDVRQFSSVLPSISPQNFKLERQPLTNHASSGHTLLLGRGQIHHPAGD